MQEEEIGLQLRGPLPTWWRNLAPQLLKDLMFIHIPKVKVFRRWRAMCSPRKLTPVEVSTIPTKTRSIDKGPGRLITKGMSISSAISAPARVAKSVITTSGLPDNVWKKYEKVLRLDQEHSLIPDLRIVFSASLVLLVSLTIP